MTTQNQKREEKIIAEEAAKILNASWSFVQENEGPDFIISENGHQFGLEVTEIFSGPTHKGSTEKTEEMQHQTAINKIRICYEKNTNNTPLDVKIIGNLSSKNAKNFLEEIPRKLISLDIANRPIGHREEFEVSLSLNSAPIYGLKIYATRAIQPRWHCVSDQVGFVNRDPIAIITQGISKKSKNISQYKINAGQDIRLLLYANRINNSGKLMLSQSCTLSTEGFEVVYFFSSPESITIFKHQTSSQTFFKI